MNQLPSEKEREPKLKAHCQPLDPNVAPSTCSPHGCPPWFSGIKPCRHARGPPPLNSHHRAPLCSLPAQDTMGPLVGAATCPSPPPPRGSPRDLKLQPQGQTCWETPCPVPAQDAVWGWAGSPVRAPWQHAREDTSSAGTSTDGHGREFQSLKGGRPGSASWVSWFFCFCPPGINSVHHRPLWCLAVRSWTSEARAAQQLLEIGIFLLDQRKEESVFRPFPTSGAIYRPEAAAITGGQQAVAWEATCVLSSPSRLWPAQSFQSTGKTPNRMIGHMSQETVLGTRHYHSWLLSFLKSFSLASKALGLGKEKSFKTAKVTWLVRVLISSSKAAHILCFSLIGTISVEFYSIGAI